MTVQAGKRYVGPGGVQVLVTKGGPGVLSDGTLVFVRTDSPDAALVAGAPIGPDPPYFGLGKRYRSPDDEIELIVVRAGAGPILYNGEPLLR